MITKTWNVVWILSVTNYVYLYVLFSDNFWWLNITLDHRNIFTFCKKWPLFPECDFKSFQCSLCICKSLLTFPIYQRLLYKIRDPNSEHKTSFLCIWGIGSVNCTAEGIMNCRQCFLVHDHYKQDRERIHINKSACKRAGKGWKVCFHFSSLVRLLTDTSVRETAINCSYSWDTLTDRKESWIT